MDVYESPFEKSIFFLSWGVGTCGNSVEVPIICGEGKGVGAQPGSGEGEGVGVKSGVTTLATTV